MLSQISSQLETDQQEEVKTYTAWECTGQELLPVKDFLHYLHQIVPSSLVEPIIP